MKITLFGRLLLSFLLVTLIPLVIVYVSTYLSLQNLEEILRERTEEKRTLLLNECNAIGQEIRLKLDRISRSSVLNQLSYHQDETLHNVYFIKSAEKLMKENGLSVLDIVDTLSGSRSSGHWPMAWDTPDGDDVHYCKSFPEEPVFRYESIKGKQFLTMQFASYFRIPGQDAPFLLSGGYSLSAPPFLDRLTKTMGIPLFIFDSLNNETFVSGPNQPEENHQRKIRDIMKQVELNPENFPLIATLENTKYLVESLALYDGPLTVPTTHSVGKIFYLLPLQSYLEPREKLTRTIFHLTLIAFFLSSGLSLWLSRRLTHPVRTIIKGLQEVAQGNFHHHLEIDKHNVEFAQLSEHFNQMTTDLRITERQLKVAERIAAWQDSARYLAHEMKNPLTPIHLSISNVRKAYERKHPQFKEILIESIDAINSELTRMGKTIKQFSDFARMPTASLRPGNINEVVKELAPLYTNVESNITISFNLMQHLPDCNLDPQLMQIVLKNLIGNALDAIEGDGGICIETKILHANEQTYIALQISDSGTGIPDDIKDKLFTPYFTTKERGTGLGLAIVHKIVTEHDGKIAVSHAPEGGTQFTIELPIAAVPDGKFITKEEKQDEAH